MDESRPKTKKRNSYKKKKKKLAIFAAKKMLRLTITTSIIFLTFSLIIATVCFVSFINTEKTDEYTVKLRTQHQTKAFKIKVGDSDIINHGYFPITALNGIVGIRVVGDKSGIVISNPSESEILHVTPDSNIITVNGAIKRLNNVVIYKSGECYLPIELIERYTCLSVSYDEVNTEYTVSSAGTENISFFPKNCGEDTRPSEIE